jgi:hypothetical protein
MEPLETFEPMVCEVLSRKAYDPEIIKKGYISSMIGTSMASRGIHQKA